MRRAPQAITRSTTGAATAALAAFLLLATYDGALRKWGLPGAQTIIFVVKDVVLAAALAYLVACKMHRHIATAVPLYVSYAFWSYAIWVILEGLNPHLPNPAVAVWGIKSHLLYAGLVILIPAALGDLDKTLKTLARIYPWLVIPVCTLAIVQVYSPPDSAINQQLLDDPAVISYFGDANLIRVSGPFSYISGMSAFSQITAVVGLALYVGGYRSLFFLIGFAVSIMSLPTTGARSVIVITIASTALILVSAAVARMLSSKDALRIVVMLAIVVAISLFTQASIWEAFEQRFEANRTDEHRTITAFTNSLEFLEIAGLTGFGSGAANYGSLALAPGIVPFSWLPADIYFEEESGRVVLELGAVGWTLSLAMRTALLLWALRLLLAASTRAAKTAAILAIPFIGLGLYQGSGVFAVPYLAAVYWFSVALLGMAQYQMQAGRHPITSQTMARAPLQPVR
jgi:hypothetical protein